MIVLENALWKYFIVEKNYFSVELNEMYHGTNLDSAEYFILFWNKFNIL